MMAMLEGAATLTCCWLFTVTITVAVELSAAVNFAV